MAFWDNWFKVDCPECGEKFKEDELVTFEGRKVCESCQEELAQAAALKAAEVEERRRAEEAARAALLDRPIDTSGKAFGQTYDDVNTGGNDRF